MRIERAMREMRLFGGEMTISSLSRREMGQGGGERERGGGVGGVAGGGVYTTSCGLPQKLRRTSIVHYI